MCYDLIGDVHGHSEPLRALLERLGYERLVGVYRHPERRAVFLGDFIDRGPDQRGVIEIVRPMIESGSALSVMGNHEFNAIGYATPAPDGSGHLRAHTDKNENQHQAFLDAYLPGSREHRDLIAWFRSLPLWLDLGPIRVVHACWDPGSMSFLRGLLSADNRLTDDLMVEAFTAGCAAYQAVETLLKGKEVTLPEGSSFHDKDGHERHEIRIRWWDNNASTYRGAFMGPESARTHIPEDALGVGHELGYGHEEPPVFVGHYWLEGAPAPLARNVACLDYSVAKPGGKLAAYRWSGETELSAANFVTVGSGTVGAPDASG
ncbi:MAG: metallophosphoesterase [Pseudomonadales bacterium]